MDNERKKEIISRLVKDGAIDFEEALELWETEKETVYIPQPIYVPPFQDVIYPQFPMWEITCKATCDASNISDNVVFATGNEILSFTNQN